MNKEEIKAFVANPGREGLYKFIRKDGSIRFRKYKEKLWYEGVGPDVDRSEEQAIKRSLSSVHPHGEDWARRDLSNGATVEWFANLDGSTTKPQEALFVQLDLFL